MLLFLIFTFTLKQRISSIVSGGRGGGAAQKPQNGKSKFLNLLILEHLKNYFIEHLNKSFDVL